MMNSTSIPQFGQQNLSKTRQRSFQSGQPSTYGLETVSGLPSMTLSSQARPLTPRWEALETRRPRLNYLA